MIVSGVDPDRAFTDNDFGLLDLGATRGNEYVWIQAAGLINAQDCVWVNEVGQGMRTSLSAPGGGSQGQTVGVMNVDLADNEYGWAQTYGVTTVNVLTNAAAGAVLNVTATAGQLDDEATGGSEIVEHLFLTTAESGGVAPCVLTYPTIGATI